MNNVIDTRKNLNHELDQLNSQEVSHFIALIEDAYLNDHVIFLFGNDPNISSKMWARILIKGIKKRSGIEAYCVILRNDQHIRSLRRMSRKNDLLIFLMPIETKCVLQIIQEANDLEITTLSIIRSRQRKIMRRSDFVLQVNFQKKILPNVITALGDFIRRKEI